MNKIKFLGLVIFLLSVILILVFNFSHKKNLQYTSSINNLNRQKDFTQEISKHIFYSYKNKETCDHDLNRLIKEFLLNMENEADDIQINQRIMQLWNKFYLQVQMYRDISKIDSPYSNITLQRAIREIYNTNLLLIVEFDKIINNKKLLQTQELFTLNILEYILFITLILLLLYLFFQLKSIVYFIQNFINKSKKIIQEPSIKNIEPISTVKSDEHTKEALENFNYIVKNIQDSIEIYSNQINTSNNSLLVVEKNIEELFDFIYELNNAPRDEKLREKEDILIQSLEELSVCAKKISILKEDLQNLITHKI